MQNDIEIRLRKVRNASMELTRFSDPFISDVLDTLGDAVIRDTEEILTANLEDLSRMDPADPRYDRLKLTESRIQGITDGIRNVAHLPNPLGKVLSHTVRPNGLKIERVSTAFGVIGIIFEARPNVSLDVFSICLKSGNACVLKGGSDARSTNRRIVSIIKKVLEEKGMDPFTVELFETTHEETRQILEATGYIDLIIPRGSSRLIQAVRDMAKVPVIETGAGIVHTFLDQDGDPDMASRIILNAKTRRVSVCNALDCLIIHEKRLKDLAGILRPMKEKNVLIEADRQALDALRGDYPDALLREVTPESYGTEFLDYRMAIKTVKDMDEALEHIRLYSSRHSECIITENQETAERFLRSVDAACLYHNAPTSFSDGGEFGLGAEIGISTQKLHARGPMGLDALTTYKWIIQGNGQVRS